MKLKFSLLDRRTFLNTLFGGWLISVLAGLFYPLVRSAFPNLGKEPDFVILSVTDFLDLEPNSVSAFAWGAKLGLLRKEDGGALRAFKGVCSHLDCNVTYMPEDRKFFCACHKGWFDHDGKNIEGPPPEPLEEFVVTVKGEDLIISKKGFDIETIPENA